MSTFVFKPFNVLSDGRKLFLLFEEGKERRQCYEFCDPFLIQTNIRINHPVEEITFWGSPHKEFMHGIASARVSLEFECGIFSVRNDPIIMGVDIFDKLTVLDYISVINEKIRNKM